MKFSHLNYFCCVNCRKILELEVFDSKKDELIEGILECPNCRRWYPITEGISFFLEDNYSFAKEFRRTFIRKHQLRLKDFDSYNDKYLMMKNKQILFFSNEASKYNEIHASSLFVKLLDRNLFEFWNPFFPNKGLVVDLGCGTGMRTLPLAEFHKENEFIATDICLDMLRVAVREAKVKGLENISFAVADAERLPIVSEISETVVGAGILHHVPNPELVIREARRILKMSGHYLGIENNNTVFRFIFDLLQKIIPVWKEKAGNHPLISISELKQWGRNENIHFQAYSRIFLPPQLINRLPKRVSQKLFGLSETIGQKSPFIRSHGGMLFIEGKKL